MRITLLRTGLTIVMLSSLFNFASGQQTDSLSLSLTSGFYLSSETDFFPHYILFEQYGEVSEADNFFVGGAGNYSAPLFNKLRLNLGFSFRNDILSSHFIDVSYDKFSLKFGRVRESLGGLDNGLSSGSLAISRNAQPIPMISFSTTDYINVPFTKGYFKVKGTLSHRWLEENRYISRARLHQKSFHAMVDLDRELGLKVSSGIIHFAQYGGTDPNGERQPSSFKDFLRVFFGQGIPSLDGTTMGEQNAIGNHLGITEIQLEKRFGDHNLTLNYQKPFEDEGGIQYVSLTDYKIGLNWDLPETNSWLDNIYVEMLQTKWQGGPGIPDPSGTIQTEEDNMGYSFGQRDDYYNNWLYRNGWTYNGNVIGNALFLTYARTLRFFDIYPDYDAAVANNRIWAIHLGFNGSINDRLSYRTLFTFSRNFGTYAGLYQGRFNWNGVALDPDFTFEFRPVQEMVYSMVELDYKDLFKNAPISLNLRLAYDTGDLYNLFGSQLALTYHFNAK